MLGQATPRELSGSISDCRRSTASASGMSCSAMKNDFVKENYFKFRKISWNCSYSFRALHFTKLMRFRADLVQVVDKSIPCKRLLDMTIRVETIQYLVAIASNSLSNSHYILSIKRDVFSSLSVIL